MVLWANPADEDDPHAKAYRAWLLNREIRGAGIPENPPPSCPCCGTALCDHGLPLDKYCARCSL